jgi:uncharacterized protein (TIGR03435 family)
MPLSQEFASSLGPLTANHLWQSTAFAAVAVLLALALRANHARARYWLWLAASVKFLVPFSALAAIGAALGRWLMPAAPAARLPLVMEQIVQPFAPIQDALVPVAASPPAPNLLPALLLALWLCGFLAVLLYAWTRWRRVAAAVRSSTPLTEGRELEAWGRLASRPSGIRLVSSAAKLEPGVFGIFRPVLWLPACIGNRLEDAELEAILEHELCHIRRRDNLLASVHMAVEAIFWFHPLVWWLGARLEEERERACDEEVVRMGGEPQIYAESILKVCEFYLASPLACAAGVTGGELKKRIEGIMSSRFARKLNFGKKVLLAAAALAAVGVPIAVGLINAPRGRAQAQAGGTTPSFEVASVKPSQRAADELGLFMQLRGGGVKVDPAQARFTSVALKDLISFAYRVKSFQISAPEWMSAAHYDIIAKIPAGMPTDLVPEMLQSLLENRFKLSCHRANKDFDLYVLSAKEGGLKIRQKPADYKFTRGSTAAPETMEALANALSRAMGRPVLDRTGIQGEYMVPQDFRSLVTNGLAGQHLSATAEPEKSMEVPSAGEFRQSLQALGLSLDPSKQALPLLVIDHAEKTPAEN